MTHGPSGDRRLVPRRAPAIPAVASRLVFLSRIGITRDSRTPGRNGALGEPLVLGRLARWEGGLDQARSLEALSPRRREIFLTLAHPCRGPEVVPSGEIEEEVISGMGNLASEETGKHRGAV